MRYSSRHGWRNRAFAPDQVLFRSALGLRGATFSRKRPNSQAAAPNSHHARCFCPLFPFPHNHLHTRLSFTLWSTHGCACQTPSVLVLAAHSFRHRGTRLPRGTPRQAHLALQTESAQHAFLSPFTSATYHCIIGDKRYPEHKLCLCQTHFVIRSAVVILHTAISEKSGLLQASAGHF